jgi:hypothetical protein
MDIYLIDRIILNGAIQYRFLFRLCSDLCGRHVAKHPYGELGSVEKSTCCCFVSLDSAFGPISPGCGCNRGAVDEMCTVLKERMRTRGDTGQIKRTEQTLKRLEEVDAKLVCFC